MEVLAGNLLAGADRSALFGPITARKFKSYGYYIKLHRNNQILRISIFCLIFSFQLRAGSTGRPTIDPTK
jgi:hypothetical protein